MRIIVFTCNYPPSINPRSFRLGNFVKSISGKQEYRIITSPVKDFTDPDPNIIRCGISMQRDHTYRNSLKKNAFIRFFHGFIWPDDKFVHQIFYLIPYLFRYRNKNDLIITVSNPFSSHLIGFVLKKIWKHQWKVDIGDSYFGNQHLSFLSKFFERLVLQSADEIIVNSDSLKNHFLQNYKLAATKISVIPNGLSIEVSRIIKIPSTDIRLSYIGNTYAGVREAIDELFILIELATKYPEKKIRIQLFGHQFYKVNDLAKAYPDLIQITYCKNAEELIQAYSNTDFLINFANKNNPGLPSKLEEYVASGLPILNFIYSEMDSSFLFLNFKTSLVLNIDINSADFNSMFAFIDLNTNSKE